MNFKTTLVSLATMALVGVLGTGCGGADCESLCEDAKECEGAGNADVDCADACADEEAAAEEAGCTDQRDAFYDCAGDVDDICTSSGSDCASEATEFATCLLGGAGG